MGSFSSKKTVAPQTHVVAAPAPAPVPDPDPQPVPAAPVPVAPVPVAPVSVPAAPAKTPALRHRPTTLSSSFEEFLAQNSPPRGQN